MDSVAARGGFLAVAASHASSAALAGRDALGGAQLAARMADGVSLRTADVSSPSRLAVVARGDEPLPMGWLATGVAAATVVGRFLGGGRIRRELLDRGALLRGASDAEFALQRLAMSGQKRLVNRVVDAFSDLEGGYVAAVLTEDRLVVLSDPWGLRAMWVGDWGDGVALASDDRALRAIGVRAPRLVPAGEVWVLDGRVVRVIRPFPPRPTSPCLVERVAVAGPEGGPEGRPVAADRLALGREMARTSGAGFDVVVAMEGAEIVAQGFAAASGAPLVPALVGEETSVRAVTTLVSGRRVALIAALVGSGGAVRTAASALRDAGASAIGLRVALPPQIASCPYGLAGPAAELLAALHDASEDGLAGRLLVDNVIAMPAATAAATMGLESACVGCLGGPWPIRAETAEDQLPLF